MKKFLIIYVHKNAYFFCTHEANGIYLALDKFEAVQKLSIDCITSIDIL